VQKDRGSGGAPADLIGPMSVAQVFELRGSIDLLGVRLRPGAIAAFGGIPADQLLDTAVPLSDLPVSLGINIDQLADIADSAAQLRLVINACRPYEWLNDFPPVAVNSPELRQRISTKWKDLFEGI